jgi:TonB family protein
MAGHKEAVTSLFDRTALARIVILSGGIPRIINNVCFNALSLGFAIGARQIDRSIIEEVACDLGIDKALSPESISLSEMELMLPVVSHPPEELPEAEDRPPQEVYAAVSPLPEAAESSAAVGASAWTGSNVSPDGGLEARTAKAKAQTETTAAACAPACVTPKEQEQKLKEETAKKTVPAVPVQVIANPHAARIRVKCARSRNRFTPSTLGKLAAGRGTGLAAASALLLGICVFAPVERRGAGRSVEAKSTAQMPAPLRNTETLRADATAPLELARAHGSSMDVGVSTLGGTRAKAKALASAGSNGGRPAAVRTNNLEERLLDLSQPQLPENLLQPQTVMLAALSFTSTDTPTAIVSPAIHALTLPTLKDAPPPPLLTSAPATRIVASSKSTYVAPRAISRPAPVYPDFAKSSRMQGDVRLLLSISRTGEVRNAMVLSGNTLLASAAENAALHWSYVPGLSNGVPVESQMQVVVRFRLQ